jgi:serine/threonine protein kinase
LVETKDGSRLANFQYAAPEQRSRGGEIDHRTDLYPLGLILNEMFTGHVPEGADPPTIASVAPAYAYLDAIVRRSMQHDKAHRYTSVAEMRSAIRRDDASDISPL